MKTKTAAIMALMWCWLATAAVHAGEFDREVQFRIEAQSLASAILRFAEQSKIQIVTSSIDLKNFQTPGLTGRYSVRNGLAALLGETGLEFREVGKGTISIGRRARERASGVESAQGLHLARAENPETAGAANDSSGQQTGGEADDDAQVVVTGSRIGGSGKITAMPVDTFTRRDLERIGAATVGDLVRYLTQNSSGRSLAGTGLATTGSLPGVSPGTGLPGMISGDIAGATTRTTVNLRGLGNNTTLVLINGRRVSRSSQAIASNSKAYSFGGSSPGNTDYDLGVLPVSAIDRVEILPDGASAIYGADAIGGVINVITRQRYTGMEATAMYGNTFKSDVGEKNLVATVGTSGPRFQAFVSGSYYDIAQMSALDRDFSSDLNRTASGGANTEIRPGSLSGTGLLGVVRRFPPFPIVPLPGLSSSAASIPQGQNGRGLTTAAFVPTSGILVALNPAPYQSLISPQRRRAAYSSLTYHLGSALSLYAEPSLSQSTTQYSFLPPGVAFTVPAGNPFNPFGVQLQVSRLFYEAGRAHGTFENTNWRVPLGLKGEIGSRFQWELLALRDQYRQDANEAVPSLAVTSVATAALAQTNPALALNVFGDDRTQAVNDPALIASIFPAATRRETAVTQSAEAKIGGELWETGLGAISGVIGYEWREEGVKFEATTGGFSTVFVLPATGSNRVAREVNAVYAELHVPVFGKRDLARPYGRLELQLAGRLDSYDDVGDTVNPQISVLWQSRRGVALRSSYSTGFKPGSVADLYSPLRSFSWFFDTGSGSPIDPLRGDPLPQFVPATVGGNPDLKPEKSRSWNFGVVLAPALLGKTTLSLDAFRTEYFDKIEALTPQDLVLFFPERAQRGPSQGSLPGPVTSVDGRLINFSQVTTDGMDLKLTYQLDTRYGTLDLTGRGTYVHSYKVKQSPNAPESERVNTGFLTGQPQKFRYNASVFWSRNAWDFGLTGRYVNAFTNDFLSSLAGASTPRVIRSNTEVDCQVAVDFDALVSAGAAHRLFGGTRATFGVINVFNEAPPPINGDGGFAVSDPRMARYYVTLRKSFR